LRHGVPRGAINSTSCIAIERILFNLRLRISAA
jgi:hypothetical protein